MSGRARPTMLLPAATPDVGCVTGRTCHGFARQPVRPSQTLQHTCFGFAGMMAPRRQVVDTALHSVLRSGQNSIVPTYRRVIPTEMGRLRDISCGAESEFRTTLSPTLARCLGAGIDERTGNVGQVQPAVTVSVCDRQMGKTEKPEFSYGNSGDRGFHR